MVGRRFKTWIACILSACLMLMSVPQALAASSAPLSETDGIALLRAYNIVRGDETGNLHLDKQITRAEMSAIVVRAMGMDDMASLMAGGNPFTDMKGYEWANGYVALANQLGLVKGRDAAGTIFDPGASITYAEAYTIFLRMIQREPAGPWNPTTIVNTAVSLGIAPSVAGPATANNPAIRGSVFGSLANAIAYVTLPSGKTILQTYVDPLPPTIVLDEVPSTTMEDSVVISGSAGDAVTVTVNGKSVPVTTGGRFSTTVDLAQGSNTITVVAVDLAGNSATKTVQVTYSLNVSRIDVKGTSQLKIGESTTITATAYTSDNRKVPDEMITASVTGSIGTYDKATGKFTANKAGEGAIVFKAGNVTETFKITVIDPAKAAAGLRIRFADEKIPYFIEGKTSVVLVEVIDKDGNVVKYDEGRKITLEIDGDVEIEDDEATTKEGVALFRVEAFDPEEEVEITASSKGLDEATLITAIATKNHFVLIPDVTVAPADGKTKVHIKAYMRDKNGKALKNKADDDIIIELEIESDEGEAELDDDSVKIKDSRDSSNTAVVIAGDEPETAIIYGKLTVPDDFEGDEDEVAEYEEYLIVPAVIRFVDTGKSDDDDEDAEDDEDEYDGYFEIEADPDRPDVDDEVELTVSVVDKDGELLDDDEYAFKLRLVLDGELVDEDEDFEWDSNKDDLDELFDAIPDFKLAIGENADWIPLKLGSEQDDGYEDLIVVGRTEDGECEILLDLPGFKGKATIEVLGHKKASEAFNHEDDDEEDAKSAASTTYFKKASITIRYR